MTYRRQFLKQLALMGAVTATPIKFALGQTKPQIQTPVESTDGAFSVSYFRPLWRIKAPRRINIPDVGEYKVLKGDFHIHTVFSDGAVMPQDRVAEAVDNGLDVIAITDHIEFRPYFGGSGGNSIKLLDRNDDHNIAYTLAKPQADKQDIILVRGAEITKNVMPPGHLNALFVEDVNPIAAAVDDWKKMIAVAADQGGFLLWNHPGYVSARGGGLEQGAPMLFTKDHEEAVKNGRLHGIEIFSFTSYYPVVSQWCEERNLAMLGNSDIHYSEWNHYGDQNPLRPMTLVFAKERSHDSVREAVFANRTVAFAVGMVIGRGEWLEKLFKACVTITENPGILELTNKSDIPCLVHAGGNIRELPAMGQAVIYRSESLKKLTVGNWLSGINQPLEIALG